MYNELVSDLFLMFNSQATKVTCVCRGGGGACLFYLASNKPSPPESASVWSTICSKSVQWSGVHVEIDDIALLSTNVNRLQQMINACYSLHANGGS